MAVLDDAEDESFSRWKPYTEYRDSGLDWLGEIPAHWGVHRLKTLASVRMSNVDKKSVEGQQPVALCNYTDVYYNDRIDARAGFMTATASREQVSRFALRKGDVLITKDSESWTDIAVPTLVTEDLPDVLCGYHLALIRPSDEVVHGAYLARAFSAIGPRHQFHVEAKGITRFGLDTDSIRSSRLTLPACDEQGVIAAFLDRETERIDALIGKKQQLIELLNEHEVAIIDKATAVGQPQRLMTLTDPGRPIMYGIVLPGPNVPRGIPIIKGGDVDHGRLHPELLHRTTIEIDALHARSRVRAGDLVYAIRGSIGAVATVPETLDGANITQDAARVSPRDSVDRRWLRYVLSSRTAFAQLEAGSVGAAIRGINIRDLKRAMVAVPAVDDQRRIADELDRETARIDALDAKVREHIALLREYRATLISAAVTGKIDVRDEVAA